MITLCIYLVETTISHALSSARTVSFVSNLYYSVKRKTFGVLFYSLCSGDKMHCVEMVRI